MLYKILAIVVLIIHLGWIIFVIYGFFYNVVGFLSKKQLLKNFWLRTFHLGGILFVAFLTVLDKYCPLTLLEIKLRQKIDRYFSGMDSFIVYYLEKLIYPDINPNLITILTYIIAILSLIFYIIKPPDLNKKTKQYWR